MRTPRNFGLLGTGSRSRELLKRRLPVLRPFVHRARAVRYHLQFAFDPKPDRHILEDVIFPALVADPGVRRVLFVGTAWYTRHYARRFPGREFWTLDVDRDQARFGSDRHIEDSLANLASHMSPGAVDAIICNGVFGYGLDEREECEKAFTACFSCLRGGGLLIVGWNDDGYHRPFPLESLRSIQAFTRHPLPPFETWRYPTFSKGHHVFDFYLRPAADGAPTPPSRAGAAGGSELHRAARPVEEDMPARSTGASDPAIGVPPGGGPGPGLADVLPVRVVQDGWRAAWIARGRDVTDEIRSGSALVVSPHPDDETLGCGVTIMRKRESDLRVRIVIATDGSGSHGGDAEARQQLARRREGEARRACARLGVTDEDLMFLGLPDGGLEGDIDTLAGRLAELIDRYRPAHVFTPVSCDGHVDHNATNLALQRAVAGADADVEVFEYPIWLWAHWPWTRERAAAPGPVRRGLVDPLVRLREARPLLVRTDGYRGRKVAAVAEYASQVQPGQHGAPPALSERFVSRFLGRHEVFLPFGALRHLGRADDRAS